MVTAWLCWLVIMDTIWVNGLYFPLLCRINCIWKWPYLCCFWRLLLRKMIEWVLNNRDNLKEINRKCLLWVICTTLWGRLLELAKKEKESRICPLCSKRWTLVLIVWILILDLIWLGLSVLVEILSENNNNKRNLIILYPFFKKFKKKKIFL